MEQKEKPYFSSENMRPADLVRAYRLHERMLKYSHLIGEMRELFLSVLCRRELTSEKAIRDDGARVLDELGEPVGERGLEEVTGMLIDLYFAHHISREDVENHVNLVRKREAFRTLTKLMNSEGAGATRIRKAVREFCAIPKGGLHISPGESMGVRVALLSRFISEQLPFLGVAKNHIAIRDLDELMERIIRNPRREGRIGGKAAGMFLAYKIILPALGQRDPEFEKYVRIPESFYFTSGFLTDFLDSNDLFWLHSQKYKNLETIEEEFSQICETIQKASFPPDVVAQFRDFLNKVGEHPLIIRSSSLLEDNVGFTFSGKYDSVFIANQGDIDLRTAEFTDALKQVLASVFSPRAILYRKDHNLLDFDERMSILVQKVVGMRHGDYFFPAAAGVAYSLNMYAWTPRILRSEGLLRMVFGLGTRAVDRIGPDYPRMVPLSHPLLRPEVGAEEIRKYSQKLVDVLDLESSSLLTVPAADLFQAGGLPDLYYAVSTEKEGHLAPPLFKTEKIDTASACVTFDNLLSKTPVAGLLKRILHRLEEAHGRPVEVEFAWDDGMLYLLQCRALAAGGPAAKVSLPESIEPQKVLFTCDSVLFSSVVKDIEYVVYVDTKAYGEIATFEDRIAVRHVVGRINRLLAGKHYALFGPGRWGTNDVMMGVKISYEDINHTRVLAEIAVRAMGASPEPSFGTHFFNDLVEANIVPVAIYPESAGTVFREDFFLGCPDALAALDPHGPPNPIVRVIDVPACTGGQYLQVYLDSESQKGVGFLGLS